MTGNALVRVEGTELFENAQIIFRNFEGREGQYNAKGQKNFCVLIGAYEPGTQNFIVDHDRATRMIAQGWNIKQLNARDEGDLPTPYLQVSMGFEFRPPRLVLISSAGRADLCQIDPETGKPREDEAALLDWVDIAKTDLIIRPYNWSVSGKSGVKAYLKTIFVHMLEDELELKYRDVPRIQLNAGEAMPLAITTGEPVDTGDFDNGDLELVAGDDGIFDAELVD